MLRWRKPVGEVAHGPQQAVHPGERQLRFGLDASAAQDAHAVGEARRVGEQRGLPDARLAPQDQ